MRRFFHILLTAASLVWGGDNIARFNFEAGERAARAGDSLQAYRYFMRAADLEPGNHTYAARKQALEQSGALTRSPVVTEQKADLAIDSTVEANLINSGAVEETKPALEPPHLTPKPGKQSFHLRGDALTIWTMAADGFGIQVLFDRTYQPLPMLRVDLTDVEMAAAFRAVQAATDSFAVPASDHTILIARDTTEKRAELTPVVAMAVPIPQRLSVQEAQEISTAIQQTLEIRRITLDPTKRVVVFRDAYSKTLIARQMFDQLSQPRAQIEVEIEFLEVAKTSTLNYGFQPPSLAPVIDFGVLPQNIQIPTPPSGIGFGTFGGGASRIGLGITDSALFAAVAKASTNTLLRSSMVALDGQPSSLHVGDRFPVKTDSFSTLSGGNAQNQSLSGGIQFVDLGLVLKLTPTVHEDGEVTLDVDAAFKTLGAAVTNGIPAIANRAYQGKVRLKDGEWAVLAGLVATADLPTITGVAGLAQIPVLGGLFSKKTHEVDSTETLVILKPRLMNLPAWETVAKPIWTGTESRPASIF